MFQRYNGLGSAVSAVLLVGGFIFALVYGWIMNLVALANSGTVDGEMILRVIGIFVFPIGVIMGWFF